MAKQRYVQDSFWTDPYIEKLTPDEKLVFLHLLTNPQCNIAGVYELRSKRLAYETGYDTEIVENILKRFERDRKVIRHNDWIIIVNHLKHQNLGDDTAKGINRIIKETPMEIQNLFTEKTLINSKGGSYDVLVLKEIDTPPIGGLQAPSAGAYSIVKLSIVKDIVKKSFGEFENVKLKDEEYEKLIDKLGENNTKVLIEELSGYIASKGKKYSNHYATLLNWARRKMQENQQKINSRAKPFKVIE